MIVGVLTTCHTQYTSDRTICIFYSIEQHTNFLLHVLQVLYMCTICDSTNINTIIEFVPNCLQHVSGDGLNGGSDSYLQFRDTHAPCLLKLCIPPSNGIVRWWLFPEFGAELPLDNCTPTIILNNTVYLVMWQHVVERRVCCVLCRVRLQLTREASTRLLFQKYITYLSAMNECGRCGSSDESVSNHCLPVIWYEG